MREGFALSGICKAGETDVISRRSGGLSGGQSQRPQRCRLTFHALVHALVFRSDQILTANTLSHILDRLLAWGTPGNLTPPQESCLSELRSYILSRGHLRPTIFNFEEAGEAEVDALCRWARARKFDAGAVTKMWEEAHEVRVGGGVAAADEGINGSSLSAPVLTTKTSPTLAVPCHPFRPCLLPLSERRSRDPGVRIHVAVPAGVLRSQPGRPSGVHLEA